MRALLLPQLISYKAGTCDICSSEAIVHYYSERYWSQALTIVLEPKEIK
jgi:hypothetical protein